MGCKLTEMIKKYGSALSVILAEHFLPNTKIVIDAKSVVVLIEDYVMQVEGASADAKQKSDSKAH